jgi:hypothetical protein
MLVNWYRVLWEKHSDDFLRMSPEQIEEYHVNMELNDALFEVKQSQRRRNKTVTDIILTAAITVFLWPFVFWYNFLKKIL